MSVRLSEPADWQLRWQPLADCIGQDFSNSQVQWGADVVEQGGIRRFLEPLELYSPIHYDREAARQHGHEDITAPCASMLTWSLPVQWRPGHPLFDQACRNGQPAYSPLTGVRPPQIPPSMGFFATEFEADFLEDAVVGDRLGRRGSRLLQCMPKETAVGRGAFLTWESEIVNQRLAVVALIRMTFYYFNPIFS